ncbi:MAG: GNAT family N-acetyltransferase [Pseudomonadota bacterium]
MTALVIRAALPVDEAPIARLHAESWAEGYRGLLPDAYLDRDVGPAMVQRWRQVFAEPEPGRLVLTATLEGTFAGFLITHPDPDDLGCDLFESAHILPQHRSRGIGTTLFREAADRLTGMGRDRGVLWVAEANARARALYARLGGVEGVVEQRKIGGQGPIPLVPVKWENLATLATHCRAEGLRRVVPPMALSAEEIQHLVGKHTGAPHPVMAQHQRLREKRFIGNPFGLNDFGVNLVEIPPGGWSSIPHAHSHEDEFVFVVEGDLVLVSGDEERPLGPGACAGFPAGGWDHHLQNRSDKRAVFLEIGSRKQDRDTVEYPGEDLRVDRREDGTRGFVRLDGTPVDEA